jgi:uncharacterized protein (DUF302 family)
VSEAIRHFRSRRALRTLDPVPTSEDAMPTRREALQAAALIALALPAAARAAAPDDGIVRVPSAYPMAETIARLKADIAAKGILFFSEIDQAALAREAGVELLPSTLLVFWPVRLLVHQDAGGQVWAVYTDFAWIARRHGITSRDKEFAMASAVIASITASVAA